MRSHAILLLTKPRESAFIPSGLVLVFFLLTSSVATAQGTTKFDPNRPVELLAGDSEVRILLDVYSPGCEKFNIGDTVERYQEALKIADDRGLIRDKALAETNLASAYIGLGKIELGFAMFQKALQDAIDSKNEVLEAEIFTALASEAKVKGNIPQAMDLISKALDISEKSGSLYEKAHALGELGEIKLSVGNTEEAGRLIDQALDIDKLNKYRFESIDLVYRGIYLGLTGKTVEAINTLAQARSKAVSFRDAYSFVMAENAYAFGLVKAGRTDEAIADLGLVRSGKLQTFAPVSEDEACLSRALELPVVQLILFEGLTNVLEAANQTEKELEIWKESYSYSSEHNVVIGEAEAAQKVADLANRLKETDDALKYYAIAANYYRQFQNEPSLAQVQVSESLLLIKIGRGKEAIPLELEVASYAKRHNLRLQEFLAYSVLAEIYQPLGELENARDVLEQAISLTRPGPFDEEIDNKNVIEDYAKLADVYKALKNSSRELVAIEKAFLVAIHLKDEKSQGNLLSYLDRRLNELQIRQLVGQREKEGELAESLIYSCILFARDGSPKPGEDNSNSNRIFTLPFRMAQNSDGAKAVSEVLDQTNLLLGFARVPMLFALARYYIASGNDPALTEKYALRSEEILKTSSVDVKNLEAESACVLAVAYVREFKNALARSKLVECSNFAKEANDDQSLIYASAASALVQFATGDPVSAKESLERLVAKLPDDPELHEELAISLANAKLYEQAASQLDVAVQELMSKGARKAVAGVYLSAAVALNSDGSPEAQKLRLQHLTSAQQIYHDLNAEAEEAEILNDIGEYYLAVSQVATAINKLEKAFDLGQKAKSNVVLAQTLADFGNAYQAQKDFNNARDFHKRAAAAYHELKNPGPESFCLQNLGRDYAALNEPDKSLSSFLAAKEVAAQASALVQYFSYASLSDFYKQQGQFEQSLTTLRDAVDIAKRAGDLEHCAYGHLGISELDSLVGAWENAVGESEEALRLFREIGDKKGQAASWADLTAIYSDRGSSIKNFDKAQDTYAKAQEFGYGKNLQLDLIEIYLQTGRYAEAANIANESVQNCLKEANVFCEAHGLLSVSEAKRMGGDIRGARSALNQARPMVSQFQDAYLSGRLLYAEAGLLVSESKLDEALASYEQLITLIESVKGKLAAKEQGSLSENYGYIYDELVSLLYSMSRKGSQDEFRFASEAPEYAEKNKARQFAESWGRTFVSQMRRSLPANAQETERALLSKRDRILAENAKAVDSAESGTENHTRSSVTELAVVQADIDKFLQQLRNTSPQYAAVAYPEAIQISTIPLRKDETFVEFKMTDAATFVWCVRNRDGAKNELVSLYKIPLAREWFLSRISSIRFALNSDHPETADWKISEELFGALFPGGLSATIMESRQIIFVPDDVLFALPFELYSPAASKGNFVLLRTPITYYPSADSFRLARTATHQTHWQEAFLGLADPITSPDDIRFAAVQAVPTDLKEPQQRTTGNGAKESSHDVDVDKLKARGFQIYERLPGTAVEIKGIAALLAKTNQIVEVRVGADATKRELLDTDLSKFRFLHFATHGILPVGADVTEPALVLSNDGVSRAHMFLSMSEILGLRLQAESVVLSACNTGTGNISRAEGVMSLGRAFLAAGSSSVTVSLWHVSDKSTQMLMVEYYKNLLAGRPKAEALAIARTYLFSQGFKDPFDWAPFIVIGE